MPLLRHSRGGFTLATTTLLVLGAASSLVVLSAVLRMGRSTRIWSQTRAAKESQAEILLSLAAFQFAQELRQNPDTLEGREAGRFPVKLPPNWESPPSPTATWALERRTELGTTLLVRLRFEARWKGTNYRSRRFLILRPRSPQGPEVEISKGHLTWSSQEANEEA